MDSVARALEVPSSEVWLHNVRGGMMFRQRRGRLLSSHEYMISMDLQGGSYTASASLYTPIPHDYRIFLIAIDHAFYYSGVGVWTVSLKSATWDEVYTTLTSRSISGHTAGRWYGFTDEINVELDGTRGNIAGAVTAIGLDVVENSGTAGFYPLSTVRYRLVAP